VLFYDAGLSVVDGLSTASKRVHISPFFAFLKMVYHKSVNDPLNKKIFCLGAVFLIFSKKKSKKGAQTSFYFAAGGGEILVPPSKRQKTTKNAPIFAFGRKRQTCAGRKKYAKFLVRQKILTALAPI